MIRTYADLKHYLNEDYKANRLPEGGVSSWFYIRLNPRLRFTRNLRYYEYFANKKRNILNRILTAFFYIRHKRLSYKLGYSIHKNNFGPGLFLCHYGTIVINEDVRIGSNCMIHVCTSIGGRGGIPKIGNNVYIGPGAKIWGDITIGDNVMIGANSCVNKSFPSNVVIAGAPAKIVRYLDKVHD